MPFSWKKKNRFSQLVADHLQSPKHGGSLVVETGFPTSLIDLYVRNRGRFRKSAVMKSTENDPQTPSTGLLIDSINLSSSSSLVSLLDSNNSSSGSYNYNHNNEIIEEDVVVVNDEIEDSNSSVIEVEKSVELTKLNPIFVAMLKVLIMLVLVLGTKKFTFGITVSAFLLFLLESFRKPFSIKPSLDSKTPIKTSFHETKNTQCLKETASLVDCSEVITHEVRSEKELDEMTSKHKCSRKAIMKSKMKKLVPKKLRRASMGSKSEISCNFKEDKSYKTEKCVEDVKPLGFSSECLDSKDENFRVVKQEYDEIVEIKRLSYSSEIYCNEEMGLRKNSGSLVLCLVVLVGLIGGRVLAVSLALSWCLMLKTLQRRNVKFFVW